ncbi:MAG: SOS response-associated peptidase family protein [Bacteroidales bacterium]|jgi:putative SOS response-associated peptidase YedK
MCFQTELSLTYKQLENRFNAVFAPESDYRPGRFFAFDYPRMPVLSNRDPYTLHMMHWGLIPSWSKEEDIRKYTLNARSETVHEKPSFKYVTTQRCLVPANGFYEWQWLDEKGKKKQRYVLTLPGGNAFGLAGLWNTWTNRVTGEVKDTFTILTAKANALLARIHNTKQRMPLVIRQGSEQAWLEEGRMDTDNDRLQACRDPLLNIPGIGESMAQDLRDLGIEYVADLSEKDPQQLYDRLCEIRGAKQDRCVLYAFQAAVYYAETNNPSPEKLKWWNWKNTNNEQTIFNTSY